MGVSGLFRLIVQKYNRTHSSKLEKIINFFFIDYNGIVYKTIPILLEKMKEKNEKYDKKKKKDFEKKLIKEIIEYTRNLICEVIKPTDAVYLAVDGPAPRAKMVQQRSRRYKGVQEKKYMNNIKKKFDIKIEESWNASANMAPGTAFMLELTNQLKKAIKKGEFSEHHPEVTVILSSGDVPGEGEHKFMPIIRKMKKQKSRKDKTICIYSGDADLIPLSIASGKNNIYVCQEFDMNRMGGYLPNYTNEKYVFLIIDKLKVAFFQNLVKDLNFGKNINIEKFIIDYNLLLSFGGNDFIHGLPFTSVKSQGIEDVIIPIYRRLYLKYDRYLMDIKIKDKKKYINVHTVFFKQIFYELAQHEDDYMKTYQKKKINGPKNGFIHKSTIECEKTLTPFQIEESRFQHFGIHSPHHKLYKDYFKDFERLNYFKNHEQWKKDYYSFYFGIDPDNKDEYEKYIIEICRNYLEALMFVQYYYLIGCPSWTWKYRFRVSPMPSDIYNVLDKGIIDVNDIKFDEGKPYTPFEQLMFILPPQMSNLMPKQLGELMKKPDKLLVQYYPIDFKVDATVGLKYMYSEAILPEIDDEFFLEKVKKAEKKMGKEDKKRNIIKEKPFKFKKK